MDLRVVYKWIYRGKLGRPKKRILPANRNFRSGEEFDQLEAFARPIRRLALKNKKTGNPRERFRFAQNECSFGPGT
jgi:hypothetical protein